MASNFRSSMAPFRRKLTDAIHEKPIIINVFASTDIRNEYLKRLRSYKESLVQKGERFSHLYDKLISDDYKDPAEQQIVSALAESDAKIISEYDDVGADITLAIEELTEQQNEERETKYRHENLDLTRQSLATD